MKGMTKRALLFGGLATLLVLTACGTAVSPAPSFAGPTATQGYSFENDQAFWTEANGIIGPVAGTPDYAAPILAAQDAVRDQYNSMSQEERIGTLNSYLVNPAPEMKSLAELAAQEVSGRILAEDFGFSFTPNAVAFENDRLTRVACGTNPVLENGNLYSNVNSSEQAQLNEIARNHGYVCLFDSSYAGVDRGEVSVVLVNPGDIGQTLSTLGHEQGHNASSFSDNRSIPYFPEGYAAGEETFMDMYGPYFAGRYLRENPELLSLVGPTIERMLADNPSMNIQLSASMNDYFFDRTYRDQSVIAAVNCMRQVGGWPLAFSVMNGIEETDQLNSAISTYCAQVPTETPDPNAPRVYNSGISLFATEPNLFVQGNQNYAVACVPPKGFTAEEIAQRAWIQGGGSEPAQSVDNLTYLINLGAGICPDGAYAVPDTNSDGFIQVAP